MIWAEPDKIGFFINTVTEPVLAKEEQVVKNGKRQSYDNQPYGHTSTVISENLYPAGHPYSWEVIGSLTDLDRPDRMREGHFGLATALRRDCAEIRSGLAAYFRSLLKGNCVIEFGGSARRAISLWRQSHRRLATFRRSPQYMSAA